jgi:hypothetical protein
MVSDSRDHLGANPLHDGAAGGLVVHVLWADRQIEMLEVDRAEIETEPRDFISMFARLMKMLARKQK